MNHTNDTPAICPQNRHILDSVHIAYRATVDLTERGFTVLGIQIGLRNPVITIASEPRCKQLRGAIRGIHGTASGRKIIWCVNHLGAQVEWRADQ